MIIIDDIKIKDAQKNLGWMLATNSAVSFSYALQGFYMPKNALVSTELHTIAMCISMALCGFGICLLAEMLKLYWAPYLECHKIGRTGKGRYLSGLFKGQDDYDLALAEKDERIPFTILYGIYTFGSEAFAAKQQKGIILCVKSHLLKLEIRFCLRGLQIIPISSFSC